MIRKIMHHTEAQQQTEKLAYVILCDKCNNANSNYTATLSLRLLLHGNSDCENKKMFELRRSKWSNVSQDPNFCFRKEIAE